MTVVAAVSPPGGDITEPVTAHTQRFVRSLWTLDRDLAYACHYPALSWRASFSRDAPAVAAWQAHNGDAGWAARRGRLQALLAEADHLASVAELVGAAALPERRRVVLLAARLAREALLQQGALNSNDATRSLPKQAALGEAVLAVHDRAQALVTEGRPATIIEGTDFTPLIRAAAEGGPRTPRAGSPASKRPSPPCRPIGCAVPGVAPIEYRDLRRIEGPLLLVAGVDGVGWDEFGEIRFSGGDNRHGVVLEAAGDTAVQVLEGTEGLNPTETAVAFSGAPLQIPIGEGWLGGACNGRGEPIDGGPPVTGPKRAEVNGAPLNPVERETPRDPVLTGVSMIDALTTLVRGPEAADLLGRRPAPPRARHPDRRPGARRR